MDVDKINFDENRFVSEVTKRIYYAETDAGGIVYFGNLCKYIEIGCAEWFRKYSCSMKELHNRYHLFFVMNEAKLSFKKPVLYDNEITIRTRVKKVQYFMIRFTTDIMVNGEICYIGENKMVPVNLNTKKPVRIPDEVFKVFDVV